MHTSSGSSGGEDKANFSGMAKFRRAIVHIRDLNQQQAMFVPKARRLSEMHQMLHRDIDSPRTASNKDKKGEADAEAKRLAEKLAQEEEDALPKDTKTKIKAVLAGKLWQTIISLITIFALYGDDLRLLAFPKTVDTTFEVLSFLALIMFFAELFLQVYSMKGYLYSFNFYLDVVSTLSLIPDIAFLWNALNPQEEEGGSDSAVLSASRASRAGTRAIRIVRIVRLVRMVRIVKLLNNLRRKNKNEEQLRKERMDGHSKVGERLLKETSRRIIELVLVLVLFLPFFDGGLDSKYNQFQNFGLAELHRVPQDYNATGVISEGAFKKQFEEYVRNSGKLFYIKICNERCATVWPKATTDKWLEELRFQPFKSGTTDVDRTASFTETIDPTTKWSFDSLESSEDIVRSKYRTAERPRVLSGGCFMDCTSQRDDPWSPGTKGHSCTAVSTDYSAGPSVGYGVTSVRYAGCLSVAYFDNTAETQNTAGMNMLKTTFVMIILAGGILGVDHDAQKLVITPIKRMVQMINKLANDPLSKTKKRTSDNKKKGANSYETHIIEETLSKVGQLMQVGFGAAGAEIIKKNLQSGSFDPMIKGKRITAIYMFCDIRQFTDTTECLQEDVMVYVNSLGDLCHGVTVSYYGMANKNVGDAFLLSWKLCDGDLEGFSHFDTKMAPVDSKYHPCPPHAGSGDTDRILTATEMADSVLAATIKICNDLALANVDGNLVRFIRRPEVIARFGKDFTIRMGYGVHLGWCIEGAIGSLQKIDCTYLSPHVELSDRLEAGSKIFKQPLNLSHWFVQLLSPAARKFLRIVSFFFCFFLVQLYFFTSSPSSHHHTITLHHLTFTFAMFMSQTDRITIPGVFTEDEDTDVKTVQPMTIFTFDITDPFHGLFEPKYTVLEDGSKEQLPILWGSEEVQNAAKRLRQSVDERFYKQYNVGINAYMSGDWEIAEGAIQMAIAYKPNDGPATQLLSYIRSLNMKCPDNWSTMYHEFKEGY